MVHSFIQPEEMDESDLITLVRSKPQKRKQAQTRARFSMSLNTPRISSERDDLLSDRTTEI